MNPYAVHSSAHQMLQQILAEPIAGQTGGWILYAGAKYPARISPFNVRQVLKEGGFSPMTLGTAIVSKSDLPAGINFKSGDYVTAVAPGGQSRDCQIEAMDDLITEFGLTLWDKNQSA